MTVPKVDNPKVEFTEEALKILRANLESTEMVAMELLVEGEKMSALVTKVHLSRVICFLAKELVKLGWAQTTKSEEKLFKCSQCDKEFNQNADFERHEREHTGEKPFPCSKCDKEFSQNADLERHECEHTGEKPFPCSKCDKEFSQNADLERHEREHTGEKPLTCSKCDKEFSQNADLERHEREHAGEKSLTCSKCNKEFSQSADLDKHLKSHERTHKGESDKLERKFKCSDCDKNLCIKELESHACSSDIKKNTQEKGNSTDQGKRKPCMFYLNGKCRHGKSGKSLVGGKTCEFPHPKTCRTFENFGYKDGGCKARGECDKGLHLNLCKQFMRGQCERETCRYFHPKKLTTRTTNESTLARNHTLAQSVNQTLPLNRTAPWAVPAQDPAATVQDNNNNQDIDDMSFLEVAKVMNKLLEKFQRMCPMKM